MRRARRRLAGAAAVGVLLGASQGWLAHVSHAADAADGAGLYRQGRWGGSGITARIEGGPRLPAGTAACAGCHGREPGLAERAEGGVAAPPLSPERLTRRGLDTEAGFAAAVGEGTRPDGSHLGAAMPRFTLAPAAVAALLAYLRDPAAVDAPGVSADRVRFGLLLPPTLAAVARPRLTAWAEALNAGGGIWARRIELDLLPAEPADLDRHLAQAVPLAVLAPAPSAAQRDVLARRGVPELAPLAPPLLPDPTGRILALGPGLVDLATELAAALAERLARPPGAAPVPVLLPAEPASLPPRLLEAIRARLPAEAAAADGDAPGRAVAAGALLVLARPARLETLLRGLPAGVVIAGPVDLLADLAARPGAVGTWLLADPRGAVLPPPGGDGGGAALDRHLAAATRLAEAGLERAGRRLTRPGLLAGLAAAPVDVGGPTPLDYAKVPGRGATAVAILEVEPAAGRLARLEPRKEPGR